MGSSTIHYHARAGGQCRPDNSERVGVVASQARTADAERSVMPSFDIYASDKLFKRAPPGCRFSGQRKQLGGKIRMLLDDARQNIEANSVAQMLPIKVRRILNEWNSMLPGIHAQRGATDAQKGANDFRFGVQACQSARSGVAKDAHEDCLDLVIERVRGDDVGVALCRNLLEELPAATPPFFFARADSFSSPTHTKKTATESVARNQSRCTPRRSASAVVERCDHHPPPQWRRQTRCRRHQSHRIEATRDCEDGVLAAIQRRLDGSLYL
jgi:hypothetical protein